MVDDDQVVRRTRGGIADRQDRARRLVLVALLLVVLASGTVDVVRGDWGRVAVDGFLGIGVIATVVTIVRLPRALDA